MVSLPSALVMRQAKCTMNAPSFASLNGEKLLFFKTFSALPNCHLGRTVARPTEAYVNPASDN